LSNTRESIAAHGASFGRRNCSALVMVFTQDYSTIRDRRLSDYHFIAAQYQASNQFADEKPAV